MGVNRGSTLSSTRSPFHAHSFDQEKHTEVLRFIFANFSSNSLFPPLTVLFAFWVLVNKHSLRRTLASVFCVFFFFFLLAFWPAKKPPFEQNSIFKCSPFSQWIILYWEKYGRFTLVFWSYQKVHCSRLAKRGKKIEQKEKKQEISQENKHPVRIK